jgi:hypothetical protein
LESESNEKLSILQQLEEIKARNFELENELTKLNEEAQALNTKIKETEEENNKKSKVKENPKKTEAERKENEEDTFQHENALPKPDSKSSEEEEEENHEQTTKAIIPSNLASQTPAMRNPTKKHAQTQTIPRKSKQYPQKPNPQKNNTHLLQE